VVWPADPHFMKKKKKKKKKKDISTISNALNHLFPL
jgi:hypothetical protein